MRTTITLEDDVAIELKRLCAEGDARFKTVVNTILRAGLQRVREARSGDEATPYRTSPVSLGRARYPDLDNIAEILAVAEGDEHR